MKWSDAAPISILIGLVFAFQYASGAYNKDFSADDDEPAHVVSSLLVRDYISQGIPANPVRFAESYYVHYPKVAIGHWPPFFYAAEGVWMLAFGRTRAAILAFTAIGGAVLAVSVFAWIATECGTVCAFVSTALLIVTPNFRIAVSTVEPEILLVLLAFWAAILYGFFLETRAPRYAWLAVFFAVCALLTHGRGAMLLFVPAIAGLFVGGAPQRRTRLALLLLLCTVALTLPWLVGQADASSPLTVVQNAWIFFDRLVVSVSWPVVMIAAVGALQVFRTRNTRARRIAMLALICSGWIFCALVNVPFTLRYLLLIAPPVAALFAIGLKFFFELYKKSNVGYRLVQLACATLVFPFAVHGAFIKTVKPDTGCHRLIGKLATWNSPSKILLVAGDSVHEGALIAEIALAERKPQTIVLRATKVLAAGSWAGRGYHLRFTTPEAVETYLENSHVGLIFAQQNGFAQRTGTLAHMQLMAEDIDRHPQVWTQLWDSSSPGGFQVFRRTGPMPAGKPIIRIDMRDKLGRFLEVR